MVLMLGAGMRTVPVAAQQQTPGALPPLSAPTQAPGNHGLGPATADSGDSPMRESAHEALIRQANEQRHKRMLDDANKMVQLSNELKADVEKTQRDELSMDVMRKAAEVEKLAHDVQQRMKQ